MWMTRAWAACRDVIVTCARPLLVGGALCVAMALTAAPAHAQARFNSLERGDLAEALNAARQIGDDTLQRNAGRVPQPHTFAHGTAEQRKRWFKRGFDSGAIGDCDTFATDRL